MLIQTPEQLTPERLTEILLCDGALQHGNVRMIESDSQTYNTALTSNVASLTVHYSDDATGARPPRLLLKMAKTDVHPEFLNRGRHEVEFYRAIANILGNLPVPHCYDAEAEASGYAHILIDDLSETHFQKPLPIPPSNRHCEMIVESLAQLHAMWWSHPRLGHGVGERLSVERAQQIRQRLEATWPSFLDFLDDGLLPAQRKAYEGILASSFLARRHRRLCELRQVTLIHGDPHTGNVMLPHDTAHHRAMLIDWGLWDINSAAIDLAFLMALHWSSQRRVVLEKRLLEHYHDRLVADGVGDYSWDDLWLDYREAVIVMTLIPIGQFRRQSPAGRVWFGVQDSMAAFEDLHCAELL
jgi:aminoglycoside phosphotransferase (APT) family kinase protein